MTFNQAIKLAIKELEREIRHLATDANLYERGIATFPHAQKAYERREELRTAIAILSQELTA